MSSSIKKIWMTYPITLVITFLITFWSASNGERFYFLIPVFLIPMSLAQWVLMAPIMIMVFKHSKFREIDITIFRKPFCKWYFLHLGVFLGLALGAFQDGNIVLASIMLFLISIHIDVFMLSYLWLRFKSESQKQNDCLSKISASNLYAAIMFQI